MDVELGQKGAQASLPLKALQHGLEISEQAKRASHGRARSPSAATQLTVATGVTGLAAGDTNPFLNLTPKPNCCAWIRRVVIIFTLLPLRIISFIGFTLIGLVLSTIASCGLSKEARNHPLAAWRQWVFWPIIVGARGMMFFCFGFYWVPVKGRCASHKEAPIVVANHTCGLIDGMYLFHLAKVAEVSYAGLPILGGFMANTQTVFVDRNSPDSRNDAKAAILRRCEEPGWPQTLIFPEGTCTNGSAVIQFKLGPFAPGKPVQPVIMRYPRPPFGRYDCSFTHPLSMGGYLLGMMMQVVNYMEVEYLPVIVPTPEEVANPVFYAERVRLTMAKELGVPATKHAGEDLVLAEGALRAGLPFDAGLVKWQELSEDLSGMRVKSALKILKQFKTLDPNGKGEVNFDGFASVMRKLAQERVVLEDGTEVTPPPPSDERLMMIFDLLDRHHDGKVDFADYLAGAGIINGLDKDDRSAGWNLAWDVHAHDKPYLSKPEVREFINATLPQHAQRFNELWEKADKNKDGQISKEEFTAFFEETKDELGINPTTLMGNLPMTFAS